MLVSTLKGFQPSRRSISLLSRTLKEITTLDPVSFFAGLKTRRERLCARKGCAKKRIKPDRGGQPNSTSPLFTFGTRAGLIKKKKEKERKALQPIKCDIYGPRFYPNGANVEYLEQFIVVVRRHLPLVHRTKTPFTERRGIFGKITRAECSTHSRR